MWGAYAACLPAPCRGGGFQLSRLCTWRMPVLAGDSCCHTSSVRVASLFSLRTCTSPTRTFSSLIPAAAAQSNSERPDVWSKTMLPHQGGINLHGAAQCRFFSSGMRNTKAGIKNPYWRHRGFWEWRRRDITAMNRRMRARKHIFPRREMVYLPRGHPLSTPSGVNHKEKLALETNQEENGGIASFNERPTAAPRRRPGGFLYDGDRNAGYVEDFSYLAEPRKGDGRVWVARRRDMPMGRKRLLLLLRLIKGLQLSDAIDWLQALALHRCNSLLNVLSKQQQQIRDEGADTSRVYIESYIIGPAGHVKTMQVGYHYRVSFLKSYRYSLALRLRELPLHELFHRTFILKQPPRSLTHDMRLAIRQKQLPPEVVRDWFPYLDAPTRYSHKRRLKQLDRQRLFNYFLARRAFVCTYTSRVRQMNEEAAAARGTSLGVIQQSFGSKRLLSGVDNPEN